MYRYIILIGFLLLTQSQFALAQIEYYVSPTGNDANTGLSSTSPFATLEHARDQIRGLASPTEVTVWLMDGDYYLNSTFELQSQDSGTSTNRIHYRALNKHQAKLHLTKRIQVSQLDTLTDPAIIARVNPAATGQIKTIDLSAFGVQNMATWPDYFSASNQQLFRLYGNDGSQLPLSRYPNDSMMTMRTVLQNEPGIFEYRDDRHKAWLEAINDGGVWLQGYWRVAWQYDAVKTASIDTLAETVTQAASVPLGIGDKYTRPSGNGQEPYIAINLLEEIDLPGEWSINFNTNKLYIWVPDGVTELEILDQDDPIFRLNDVSYVDIIDLTFDYSLGSAIIIQDGYDNLVAGCDISHCIEDAIRVLDGSSHDIVSNDIHDLGAGGIFLSGGDRATLTHANHTAVNNHIYEFGQVKVIYGAAIEIPGRTVQNNVGMYVAHNKIHGTPHVGILFCGNNNIFEYNEIYDICRVSNDMGAFYSWADWTSYGNIIRYNYVHDAHQAHGVYWDDGDSGDQAYNNIMQNIDVGVFMGGGHDNIARNNLVIDCEKAVHIDNRGVSRGYNLSNTTLVNRVLSVDYQNAPWSTQYPSIVSILDTAYEQELPVGSTTDCNVAINTPVVVDINASTATSWQVSLGTEFSDTDPSLASAGLAQIDSASGYSGEACIGVIPVDSIGLINDQFRTGVSPLPIEWLAFSATPLEETVALTWISASESNNKGFEVQHSLNATQWEVLGFVEGQGNSASPTTYTFTHESPITGANYYRLRQVDFDGQFSYSNIRQAVFHSNSPLNIYPNPASESLTLQFPAEEAHCTIQDLLGRTHFEATVSPNQEIDIEALESGLYILELKFDDKKMSKKFIKE